VEQVNPEDSSGGIDFGDECAFLRDINHYHLTSLQLFLLFLPFVPL